MNILHLKSIRHLSLTINEKIYEGENKITSFGIELPNTIGDYPYSVCQIEVRAYLGENEEYISYKVDTSKRSSKLKVTSDITEKAQTVYIMFVITHNSDVIGKTNKVDLKVCPSPPKDKEPLTPREQFDQRIAELEGEVAEQAQTITEQEQQIVQKAQTISGLNTQVEELTTENATLEATVDRLIHSQPTLDTPDPVTPSTIQQTIRPEAPAVGLTAVTVNGVTTEDVGINPEYYKAGEPCIDRVGSYAPLYGTAPSGIYVTEVDEYGYPIKVVVKDMEYGGSLTIPFSTAMRTKVAQVIFEGNIVLSSIAGSSFRDYVSLERIEIPSGVTSIGDYAFYNNQLLEEVVVPNGVTSIGQYAFASDVIKTEPLSISLPESLSTINQYAFQRAKLDGFRLPSNIKTIGTSAFHTTTLSNQEKIIIPHTVTSVGNDVFRESNVTDVDFLANVTKIPSNMFYQSSNIWGLLNVYIGDGITTIGSYCFYNRRALRKLRLPSSITTFESNWNGNVTADGGGVIDLILGDGWNLSWNVGNVVVQDRSRIATETVLGWLYALKDLTGETAKTLTIGPALSGRLTPEEIAIATNKNWNLT